jgi:DnaJ-class molecular chaperone
MLVDNFKEIHRRMLGELKPQPVLTVVPACRFCHGTGWHPNQWGSPMHCMTCGNPERLPQP